MYCISASLVTKRLNIHTVCINTWQSQSTFVSFQVTYTFDAGPNAVIFILQQHVPEFVRVVQHFFPPETNGGQWVNSYYSFLALNKIMLNTNYLIYLKIYLIYIYINTFILWIHNYRWIVFVSIEAVLHCCLLGCVSQPVDDSLIVSLFSAGLLRVFQLRVLLFPRS